MPPRPLVTHAEPRRALAHLAAAQAGPQPETVVAVTGTNGKTSTADFFRQLAPAPAASLGTLGVVAPGRAPGAGLTTPGPGDPGADPGRPGEGRRAVRGDGGVLPRAGQFRLDGVRLAAAGFTNFTRDHLDYHGGMDAYRTAKLRLFTELLPPGAPAVASTELDAETVAALRAIADARGLRLQTVGRAAMRSACSAPCRIPAASTSN